VTLSLLRLTDGTETINLMTNELDGFFLQEYRPVLSGYKGGGSFQDSPLADNRRPVYTRRETVVQPFILNAKAVSHDNMARMLQDLLRLLEKAKDYWVSDWYNTPVWLEAKTAKETNLRYALVYMGRVEDYPAPYEQPFTQPGGTPVAQEIGLFLELGQWLDVDPTVEGGSDLAIVAAKSTINNEISLFIEGWAQGGGEVDLADAVSNANIEDLPDGVSGFTVDFWAKLEDGFVTEDRSIPFTVVKGTLDSWSIGFGSTINFDYGIRTVVRYDAGSGTSSFNIVETTDRDWHHYAMTFIDSEDYPRFFLDGVEKPPVQTAPKAGSYISDVGGDLEIIATPTPDPVRKSVTLGYFRLSNTRRWTSTFTPPELCNDKPAVDANTMLQYDFLEGTGTAVDNEEGTAASDLRTAPASDARADSEWSPVDGCDVLSTNDRTTDEVFVANKSVLPLNITNWHIGTGGANLIGGSWPANVFSGTTDTYVGSIDGPFNSIVLDTTSAATATPTWQYWNGAWVALTLSNTLMPCANLACIGEVVLSWKPPTDWVAASPGGSLPSGFYVRQTANIGTIQHAGPDDPFTPAQPFIQVDDFRVLGDIPALARMLLRPVGSDGTNNSSGAADKIIYGVRSLSRGSAFRSHINMSDTGNVSGIDISQAPGAFISDTQAPTGRLVSYSATTSFANIGAVFINGAISRDYAGRFRCFIRFSYDINTANTLTWIFRTQYGTDGSFFDSRPVVIDDTYEGSTPLANAYLLEFSPIHIRSDLLVGNDTDIAELIFYPFVKTDTGTSPIRLHDIVLIPTDEFSGEVERIAQSGLQANALDLIDLDGTNQKLYSRAVKRSASDNRIKELWLSRGVLPPSLQANVTQRIFFLQRSTASAANLEQSVSWQTLGVRLGKVSRYLGFRGDR